MRTCRTCNQDLPLTSYYRNKNCVGGYTIHCKKCQSFRYRDGVLQRAKRDRAYFQQVKLERGCTDCGYNANAFALDFDHLPGTVKRYRIATMAGMKRELVDAEIAKCEVVCANCHRVRTHARLAAGALADEDITIELLESETSNG